MIIFASVQRVLSSKSRVDAMLLMVVAAKTLEKNENDDDGESQDESHDSESDKKTDYSDLYQLIVAIDCDVLPSFDPRITYALNVERDLDMNHFTLEGAERERQKRPWSKRFSTNDSGQALVYRIESMLRVESIAARPVTCQSLVRLLSPGQQSVFRRALNKTRRPQDDDTLRTLAEVDSKLGAAAGVTTAQRWIVVDCLIDMCAPVELIMAASSKLALGRPSSLRRLSIVELLRVMSACQTRTDMLRADKIFVPWYANMTFSRYVDMFPVGVSGTRRRLVSQSMLQRRWLDEPGARAIDALVQTMRMAGSTVGSLFELANVEQNAAVKWLVETGMLRRIAQDDDGDDDDERIMYANGRDYELELEAARLLLDERIVERVACLSAAGDAHVIYANEDRQRPAFWRRLVELGLLEPTDEDFLCVAPTIGHAATCGFDCETVDDILCGRVYNWRVSTLILVHAHCFGVDSFVHTLRYCTHQRRIKRLVLVGDPFASVGSPRESDRGCVMRDICAAVRRGVFVERATYTSLFGLSGATKMGPLSARDHDSLRRLQNPSLPEDEDTFRLYDSIEEVPLDVRDVGIILVGTPSLVEALETVGSHRDASSINRYLAFDELGHVARVKHAFRSVYVPATGWAGQAVSVDGQTPTANLPMQRNNVFVEIDCNKMPVDHRQCCGTQRPTIACLSMHAQVRSLAGTPARLLARISPVPVADELVFVVTERTGIEDVRAAFSMVKRRLHIVCGRDGPDALRQALNRHGTRARTRLVDVLMNERDAVLRRAPMTLLEYSGRYDVAANVHEQEPPLMDAPFLMSVLGTTSKEALERSAVGTDARGRRLVSVSALRQNLEHYLMNGVTDVGDVGDVDDSDDDFLHVQMGVEKQNANQMLVFNVSDVDGAALASIDFRLVDDWVRLRLRALICTYRIGTLGDDIDDDELEEAVNTYPPDLDEASVARYMSRTRALKAREAAIVHVLCKIVKGAAETWFIEAERRMIEKHLDDQVSARQHATALRDHLDRIDPLVSLDDAPEDVHNLFEKLHFLREYLVAGQGDVENE